MKQRISIIIKSSILTLALSSVSLAVQARDSLESLRNDLNAAVTQINTLQSQNAAQQTQIDSLQTQVEALAPQVSYDIGDVGPAGGTVFYLSDATGKHGLEASSADWTYAAPWGCYGSIVNGADSPIIGSGLQNTADILAGCDEAGIAAEIANNFFWLGFGDWFLPSREELNLLYVHRGIIGNFTNGGYWSSTEYGINQAWDQSFGNGTLSHTPKNEQLRVRPIRAF
jgi:type II secretory pathway pseudopilin PulG